MSTTQISLGVEDPSTIPPLWDGLFSKKKSSTFHSSTARRNHRLFILYRERDLGGDLLAEEIRIVDVDLDYSSAGSNVPIVLTACFSIIIRTSGC